MAGPYIRLRHGARDGGHLDWPAFQRDLAERMAADPEKTAHYEHWLLALEAVVYPATHPTAAEEPT